MQTTITPAPINGGARTKGATPRGMLRALTALLATLMFGVVGITAVASSAQAASIPGRCTYTNSEPTRRQGDTGAAVRQIQCELNFSLLSSNLSEDGDFGPATARTVRTFQACARLAVDGVVGPNTWAALNFWARSSSWCDA